MAISNHDVHIEESTPKTIRRGIHLEPEFVEGKVTKRDRLSEGAYISVELAPIKPPRRAAIVAAVRSVIGLGANARAGRTITGRRWTYDPADLDAQAERMVTRLPDWYRGSASLPRLRSAVDSQLPFTVFLGSDRAALCIDHRLGDGFLSVLLTAAVFAESGVAHSLLEPDDKNPLPAAIRTTFLRHPDRFLQILRDRSRERSVVSRRADVPHAIAAGHGQLELETAVMNWHTYQSLVRWAKGKAPTTVAMIFALRAALERSGVGVADTGSILVDLRRYLPSGRSTLANFVVGQPVSLTSGMADAGERFAHDLRLGRPLAALTAGVTLPTRQRLPGTDVPSAATPTVSDMGFLRALESVPWATDEPMLSVSVDPAARNGITALTSVLRRRLNVSLSFDGIAFERSRVAEACALFITDPIGLLA